MPFCVGRVPLDLKAEILIDTLLQELWTRGMFLLPFARLRNGVRVSSVAIWFQSGQNIMSRWYWLAAPTQKVDRSVQSYVLQLELLIHTCPLYLRDVIGKKLHTNHPSTPVSLPTHYP